MSDPKPIKAGTDSRRNWKTINEVIQSQKLQDDQNSARRAGIAELRKRPKDTGIARRSWRFAAPREYDSTSAYAVDEIVIVSPTNNAVTTGVTTAGDPADGGVLTGFDGEGAIEDIALPGLWVCLRAPRVLSAEQPTDPLDPPNYDIHVPSWPPPDLNPDGVDAGHLNYWWPISFYPALKTDCDGEGNQVEVYYNATDKHVDP